MIRPLLSLDRLFFLASEGKVGYRYGQAARETETMDYLEFIARVTSHIYPDFFCTPSRWLDGTTQTITQPQSGSA